MAFACKSTISLNARVSVGCAPRRGLKATPKPRCVTRMAFESTPLPYEIDALEPHMSKDTLSFHWGKHLLTYVTNVNTAVAGTDDENLSMEEIMKKSSGGLFNNSAQVWNHDFFFQGMSPNGGGKPTGKLLEMIESSFGSFEEFSEKFQAAGAPGPAFGSGWVWLVANGDKLEIQFTQNAENPLASGTGTPIVTYDVWEHAYYLDHQNLRPRYIKTFMENLVNWEIASERLG